LAPYVAFSALNSRAPGVIVSPLTPTAQARLVTVLIVLSLLGNMSLQIVLPALPSIQASFQATPGGVQLLVSLGFIVYGFAQLIFGPLADNYGRRRVFLAGMLVYSFGSLICLAAQTLPILILGRVITAFGTSVNMVLPRAIVRDAFAGHDTAKVLARIAMAAAITPMISPPIGGVINDHVGWRALFGLLVLIGLGSSVTIYFFLPETLRDHGPKRDLSVMFSGFAGLVRDRRYMGYALNGAFIASIFMVFMTSAPFIYIGLLDMSASTYALYYMTTIAGFLLGSGIAARAAARVAINRMIVVSSVAALIATVVGLLVCLALPWSPWAFTLPVIALAIASGTLTPNVQAAIVSGDVRIVAAASGFGGFLQMIISAFLIQAVSFLPHTTPYPTYAAMVASACAGGLAIWWGLRTPRSGER
jgi:DHA1 family bicyclomycin/chloramphenicol resistance-like MFS transporter